MNINYVKKLMERKKNAKKGENGQVLVIGGSEDNVGSLALAGLAALRAGCDVVTVASSEKIAWAVTRYTPDLQTFKIKGAALFTVKNAKEMVKKHPNLFIIQQQTNMPMDDLVNIDENIKKLKGREDIFRVRKGNLRIIYRIEKEEIFILTVERRSEKTYRDY